MSNKIKLVFEDTDEEVWPVGGRDGNVVRLFTSEPAAQAYAQAEGLRVMPPMRVAKAESVWAAMQVNFDANGTPSFGSLERARRRADATRPHVKTGGRAFAVFAYDEDQAEIIARILCARILERHHDNPKEPFWACIHEETHASSLEWLKVITGDAPMADCGALDWMKPYVKCNGWNIDMDGLKRQAREMLERAQAGAFGDA